jgi:hypothetical protein
MSAIHETRHAGHPASWWAQFEEGSDKFDAASVTEALSDVITPSIRSALLRREAEIATDRVLAQLNKPASSELAERAGKTIARLAHTVERLNERATGDHVGTAAADALCLALQGHWAEAAAAVEPLLGTTPLLKAFVSALRLERFGTELTLRLLNAGHTPATAVRCSLAMGRYGWWPAWLQKIVAERALAGTLCAETITALQRCAYAELSPTQARMAQRLINAEPQLVEATAYRLETLGEHPTASKLRQGDLTTVAFAARLIPV